MSIRRLSILALAVATISPAIADAQVINRPQRAFRGLFGGGRPDPQGSRQELSVTFNALGGYDDNASVGEGANIPSATPTGGSSTGTFDANLTYLYGSVNRSLSLHAGAGLSTYGNAAVDPSQNFSLGVTGSTRVGSRTTLSVVDNLRYTSLYRLDTPLTDAIPVEDLPTTDSAVFGLGDRSSVTNALSASIEQRVSRTGALTGSYGFTTTSFPEGTNGGYEAHNAGARYAQQVGRWTSIHAEYDYGKTQFGFVQGDDEGRPLDSHQIAGGLSWQRRLSPRRTFFVSFSGGAMRLESLTGTGPTQTLYQIWTPFGEFSTRLDLGRDWNLGAQYRRGAQTLGGLSTEAFVNDAGTFTLSGLLTRRLDVAFIAGVARGATASGVDTNSTYLTTTGSTQLRFALSRMLSTVVSYHYYHYNFHDTVLPEGLAPVFGRNAVRVGVSVWLPLYGRYDRQ
jgi:hypothetical protein